MIKRCFLILLIIIPFSCFAQATKTYLTLNGTYTADPMVAASYVIVQKLEGDSAFKASQYNMQNIIMSIGYYKDNSLSIPDGKFIYYANRHSTFSLRDTIIAYVAQVGYYENGKKTGKWITYQSKGVKLAEETYEHNHRNGPYIDYEPSTGGWITGTMVNDEYVGSSYRYNADSLMTLEIKYKNGRVTRQIEHLIPPDSKYDFSEYLEKKLKPYKSALATATPSVCYLVTKEGNILDPVIVNGVNHQVDSAIIVALKMAPLLIPAKHDGVAINMKVNQILILFSKNYARYHPYQDSFKFMPVQRIESGTYSTLPPRSDGSYQIEYRVPSQ